LLNDERILLIEGTLLYGVNNKYLVGKLRGKGGSSLVYYGTRIEDDLPILIKEIYPFDRSNCIIRDNDQIVKINDDLPKEIIEKAEMLLDTCKNKALNEKALLSNLAINYYAYSDISIDCFSQFNTVYTIFQNKDDGCVLSTESKQSFLTYIKYIKRILEALEPLHNAGYLHLDIAPDNIYKTKIDKEEPVLKLIDFNSSIKISDVRSVKVLSSKEGFSAYEVLTLKRDKIGIQSDLYSVTACLFYWLALRHGGLPGLPPFT
jgi:serine/threonine protein kinase